MPSIVTAPPVTRYVGIADAWGRHVFVDRGAARRGLPQASDEQLLGFAWGRRGAGARELARAILADATGNPMLAERLCRDLALEVIAHLPEAGFVIARETVLEWVALHDEDEDAGPR